MDRNESERDARQIAGEPLAERSAQGDGVCRQLGELVAPAEEKGIVGDHLAPESALQGRVEFIVCGCIHLTDCNAKSAGGLLGFDFSRKDEGPSTPDPPSTSGVLLTCWGSRSSGRSY
jgi:hypothetical protein